MDLSPGFSKRLMPLRPWVFTGKRCMESHGTVCDQ